MVYLLLSISDLLEVRSHKSKFRSATGQLVSHMKFLLIYTYWIRLDKLKLGLGNRKLAYTTTSIETSVSPSTTFYKVASIVLIAYL